MAKGVHRAITCLIRLGTHVRCSRPTACSRPAGRLSGNFLQVVRHGTASQVRPHGLGCLSKMRNSCDTDLEIIRNLYWWAVQCVWRYDARRSLPSTWCFHPRRRLWHWTAPLSRMLIFVRNRFSFDIWDYSFLPICWYTPGADYYSIFIENEFQPTVR